MSIIKKPHNRLKFMLCGFFLLKIGLSASPEKGYYAVQGQKRFPIDGKSRFCFNPIAFHSLSRFW